MFLEQFHKTKRTSLLTLFGFTLLFLFISANYIGNLFPCSIQKIFSNNIYIQHLLAFISCLLFCVIKDEEIKDFVTLIKQTFIIYLLFILYTKLRYRYNLSVIILSVLCFLINMYKIYYYSDIHDYYINNTEQLNNNNIKETLNKHNLYYYNFLTNIQYVLYIIIISIIIIGFGQRFIKVWKLEGSKFNNIFSFINYFIFREKDCKVE